MFTTSSLFCLFLFCLNTINKKASYNWTICNTSGESLPSYCGRVGGMMTRWVSLQFLPLLILLIKITCNNMWAKKLVKKSSRIVGWAWCWRMLRLISYVLIMTVATNKASCPGVVCLFGGKWIGSTWCEGLSMRLAWEKMTRLVPFHFLPILSLLTKATYKNKKAKKLVK